MITKIVALTLPLTLDTFLIAAAIGLGNPSRAVRLRLGGLFALFEGGMPLVGLALGQALSGPLGGAAEYVAIAILAGFGVYTAFNGSREDDDARRLVDARGLTVLALGLGISLDGLALGFTYGVLRLPVAIATGVIVGQAFIASQAGFLAGRRIPDRYRRLGEKLAGWALVGIAGALLSSRLSV